MPLSPSEDNGQLTGSTFFGFPSVAGGVYIAPGGAAYVTSIQTDVSGVMLVSGSLNLAGQVGVSNFPAIQSVSGTVTIGGQVSVNNFPATQNVSGSVGAVIQNWPALQGVSGTIGVNNFPAVQAVSGTVGVNNFPAIQAISGGVVIQNWPATINVSGSVTTTQGITQTAQNISGSVTASLANDYITLGSLTAANQTAVLQLLPGYSSLTWQLTGSWTGTVFFEKSSDNITWFTASFYDAAQSNAVNFVTASGNFFSSLGSNVYMRIRASSVWAGSAGYSAVASFGVKAVAIQDALPAGNNTIGNVGIVGIPPVSIQNWPATLGVSASATLPVSQQGQVQVSNFPATQAVSGTVTSIIGNWPALIGVSGSVTTTPAVTQTAQNVSSSSGLRIFNDSPVGVSASVAFRVWDGGIQGISASTVLPVWNPGPVGISGTVSIGSQIQISNFPAVQAISGTVTSLNGPTSVYTSGLQGISGTVGVNNFPATQNVSGSVTLGAWGTNVTGSVFVTATGSTGLNVGNAPYMPLFVTVTSSLPVSISGQQVTAQLQGYSYSSYSPDPSSYPTTNQTPITIDAVGRLETHATTTSDEGSFRDDFTGTALPTALVGTVNFTNGSITVTGVGTSFTTSLITGDWIKKTSDSETLYAQISAINSDTQLTLANGYTGTSAATTAVVSHWQTTTAATGGSVTAAASIASLTVGTTTGQSTYITRLGDYLPYTLTVYCAISQRIANQTAFVGFRDQFASPNFRCELQFTGTNNTTVQFVVSGGPLAGDTFTSPAIAIPNGGTTAGYHIYKLDLSGNQATLSIDGIPCSTHNIHLPGPYTTLNVYAGITNTGATASATTLTLDTIYFYNTDRVQIDDDFVGEPLNVTGSVSFSGIVPASIQNWPAAFGVSGTLGINNFPAIQAVSGTLTLGSQVQVSNFPATQAISGTVGVNNFPATQNVSGTVIANGPTAIGASGSSFPVIAAGLDVSGSVRALRTDIVGQQFFVTPPRNRVSITFQSTATATADTLLSLVKSINGNAQAGATSIAVTSGKTLRITSMTFSLKANAAAAAFATFTVRLNPTGAAVIGSQSELRVDLGNTAATAGAADKVTLAFPDGFELSGAQQLAISAAAQATTNILSVALNGYEY